MTDAVFTLTQALEFVGLLQSVFVIVLTLLRTDDYRFAALPLSLFGAFALAFLLRVLVSFGVIEYSGFIEGIYLFVDTLVPALSYLLVLELVRRSVPDSRHWLILGLPVLAVPVINVAVQTESVCMGGPDSLCVDPFAFFALYRAVTGMAILLLLTLLLRRDLAGLREQEMGKEKYWIVIAVVGLNLALIAAHMAGMFALVDASGTSLIVTVLELTLIYLVMSSLFRVYAGAVPVRTISDAPSPRETERTPLNDEEKVLVARIRAQMDLDKVYQEATYSRKDLAQELGIAEHQLSRIINTGFEMSFSDLINKHRVEEAKYMLRTTEEPISTIAFDVGFNSLASFNRVFRKVVEQTPTDYRNTGEGEGTKADA
ncbi:MAG: AraC family transcriptional regulator [Proteobacteria bacterium]|nr:AraC family transcriptional regulator [Pseudomonadota bacterium]